MLLFFSTFIVIVVSQDCDYKCNANKGCTVQYVGPPRAGKLSGRCFPQSFGGSCSGTPRECQDCNKVLICGGPGGSESGGSHNNNSKGGSNHSNDLCTYECKSKGGCGATYVGPFRSGSTSGSCFSKPFGGTCIGIPPECADPCHHFCFNGQLIETQTTEAPNEGNQTTRSTQQTTRSTQQTTRSTQRTTRSTKRTTGPTQETTKSTIKVTTTKQPPSKILKPNEKEFVENVNKIEFEIETIRESALAFVLKEDIINMKMIVGEIMELDEDLTSHEQKILQNVSDVTKQLFYFHQIIENSINSEETNGPPDQFLVGVSKNEDCDLECLQAKFPWLRVARSVSHRRFRRQSPREQSKMENVKNGQSAIDEADDSALRVKSLLEEYKQGLVDSSKCDAGKKKLVKILETESQNMNKQLEAAMKIIQDFVDEKIKTITVQGTGKSWRFKRCELIWGREFVNEVGETGSMAEESAESATECEKECDKYDDCVCWSFKDGVCHLKDESYCEKLSDDWDINVVSAIAVQCLDRVEVCSIETDTCDWRPARELDLGSCIYNSGAIMVDGKLPEQYEEGACVGLAPHLVPLIWLVILALRLDHY